MITRVSLFCDKLLEAGWLAALIVAPLFFNVYSSRVFEPDKISLVRSIALLMAGAWIVRQLESGRPKESVRDTVRAIIRDNPLILPTLAIVVVYLIATLLSVAPAVTFWGSYQRLQGTYTTLSYIVVFLTVTSTMRTRAQLDRAIGTAVAVSFPVAFYGIIQHYKLDPLPWGGDTTERVASNMGNSIFAAAFMIMAVPLTVWRWIETLTRLLRRVSRLVLWIGAALVVLLVQVVLWAYDFALGTGFALTLLSLCLIIGLLRRPNFRDLLLGTIYSIILAAQFVAIFFTQSRGPWLGLGAGLFAFAILGALMIMHLLPRMWRTITMGAIIGTAALVVVFLVVFNLPSSPLESLKRVPYIGRLGQILDPASPTARVRELIWQGALKLALPHDPLWSPTTGSDPYNAIRPLVGYGPEAMYVAFNPFYPPELGQLEARNASPDRSHNETFDSLVTTGLIGFGAYIFLFISIFYFGLKSLGLIASAAERNLFVGLWLITGFAFALFFGAWRGWHWIGVALPAGMIVGFLIFLVSDALRRYRVEGEVKDVRRALTLGALIAALIAHFVEIHFGIAIVSTRTYFWFYAALLVVVGMNLVVEPTVSVAAPVANVAPPESARSKSQRRRPRRRTVENVRIPAAKEGETSPAPIVAWTVVTSLVLITLAFEFITNQSGGPNPLDAVKNSLFIKGGEASYGIFALFALMWIVAGAIGLTLRSSSETWIYDLLLFVILSFTAALWFVMFQTRWITASGDLTDSFINLLALYYVVFFLILVVLAIALWFDVHPRPRLFFRSPWVPIIAPVLAAIIVFLVYATDFNGIRADILYKAGTNDDTLGAWDRSIDAYKRALDLQPTQDFYSLFLGRAYLEGARSTTDNARRAQLLSLSERALLDARQLNPLNTDHSANLARMERIVAPMTDKPDLRAAHYQKSSGYYADATRLSPNTAYLRNEWYLTLMQSGDAVRARQQLDESLGLDPRFAQTYVYYGDFYYMQRDTAKAVDNYLKALEFDGGALFDQDGNNLQAAPAELLVLPEYASRAIETFRAVAQKTPRAQPYMAIGEIYKRTGKIDLARQAYEQAVQVAPNDLMANLALVNFLSENGYIDAAVVAMGRVIDMIPRNRPDYARFQEFNAQLQNLQRAIQAVQKAPGDVNARRALATIWKARGQSQFALPEYQAITRLVATDYDAQKNLALLDLQMKRLDDAQQAIISATVLAPDNEKPLWQNVQIALNAQKAGQFAQALQAAQAALALASDQDKIPLQVYVSQLQDQTTNK